MNQEQKQSFSSTSSSGLSSSVGERPDVKKFENVHVEHGANDLDMPVSGFSVGQIKKAVAETLNVPPEAVAYVNSQLVDDSYILQAADRCEFIRESGRKGASCCN